MPPPRQDLDNSKVFGELHKKAEVKSQKRLGTGHCALDAQFYNYTTHLLQPHQGAGIKYSYLNKNGKKANKSASPFTFHYSLVKNAAFTLAEVLITLGIIGVVAAMTIPALIGHYKKVQTVTQLKKVYSALQQSVQLSQTTYGDINTWDWTLNAEEFFKTYMSSNLKVIKYCGTTDLSCWNDEGINYLSGGKHGESPLDRGCAKLILSDGTFIGMEKQDNNHTHIFIDLNGKKHPNTAGKDIFVMTFTSDELIDGNHNISKPGLYLFGNGLSRNELKTNQLGCANNKGGLTCGALIMLDGWEMKSDYPQ